MPCIREVCWDRWAEWTHKQIDLDAPDTIAIDTETMGLGYYDDVFAAQLTWRSPSGELRSGYINLDTDEVPTYVFHGEVRPTDRTHRLELLRQILDHIPRWVLHNAKFDLQKLILIGATTYERVTQIELHDTQTLYVLLDENGRKGLKELAVRVLGYDDTICVEYKSGKKKGQSRQVPREKYLLDRARRKLKLTKDDGFHLIPRSIVVPYALKDTEFTLQLFEILKPRLEALRDPRLLELYDEFMELILVLLNMEEDGFDLDLPYLEPTASDYGVRVMEGQFALADLTGDPEFNPNAWQQILAAYERRGYSLPNTQAATLEKVDDELTRVLLQYRGDKKILDYLAAMKSEHRDGRIHPNFNPDAARTGRMSSSAASNN